MISCGASDYFFAYELCFKQNRAERKVHMDLKTRIENLLSEILSDKYECKVTLHFEKKVTE